MILRQRAQQLGHARRRLAAKRAGTVACDRMEEATASAGVNVDEIILVEQLLDRLDSYNEQMDSMLGNLSEEDAKMLNQLLDKIRNSE